MLKLDEARENYYVLSGKLSDVTRQLALGGIAAIWLFKVDTDGVPKVPAPLMLPLALIAAALAADLLHYAVAALWWGSFHRAEELKDLSRDRDLVAPHWINLPAIIFMFIKVLTLMTAYGFLLSYVQRVIR